MQHRMEERSTAGHPMLTPIRRPALARLGRKVIRKHIDDRNTYVRQITDAAAQGRTIQLDSIVSSVSSELLDSLILFNTFTDLKIIS